MLRTVQSLPLERAFDTGLRPDPFPDRAASLLPGLLAATRTGLPPASDDELTTTDQPPTRSTSCLLGARENLNGALKSEKRHNHPPESAHKRLMKLQLERPAVGDQSPLRSQHLSRIARIVANPGPPVSTAPFDVNLPAITLVTG